MSAWDHIDDALLLGNSIVILKEFAYPTLHFTLRHVHDRLGTCPHQTEGST